MTAQWARRLAAGGDAELVAAVVRLAATVWVTPGRIRDAVAACLDHATVTAAAVADALAQQAVPGRRLADTGTVESVAAQLLRHGAVVRVAGEPDYPAKLTDAWPELGAPLWVFVRGIDGALPSGPAVAIVGTRHPTLDGTATARELGRLLGRHGVVVVSGMARGIDQAGHSGALDAGGPTVGVLGTGFGVDYPRHDAPLREAVAAAGGLVTELIPGTPPHKRSFLWRNRIIAGLADLTVVVEGRARSGALHTARMAGAQGRDVMAVPGPVRAPASRAPLDLIRDGAVAVTQLTDVLDHLGVATRGRQLTFDDDASPHVDLSDDAEQTLRLLGGVPASPSALAAATQLPVSRVMAAVAELTGNGLAASTPRGVVRSAPAAV